MKFEEIYKQVEDITGWMPKEDCACLNEYASKTKGVIVEIGALVGRSTTVLSLSSPKSKIHSCDKFIPNMFFTPEETRKLCLSNMNKLKNVTFYYLDSLELARKWDRPIDLLFIDGDHTMQGVLDDTKYWLPFLKPSHFVLYHDYHDNDLCLGVKEAVDTLTFKNKLDFYYQGTKSSIKICQK